MQYHFHSSAFADGDAGGGLDAGGGGGHVQFPWQSGFFSSFLFGVAVLCEITAAFAAAVEGLPRSSRGSHG